MLLKSFLDFSVNWRDFYTATDRKGVKFYYPKPEIIPQLEIIGSNADRMRVNYEGTAMSLVEAYNKTITSLVERLENDSTTFEPFSYDPLD